MRAHSVPPERAFGQSAEVRGYMIVAYLESAAAASRTFAERLRQQLSAVGIDRPTSDEWYSATAFQTALFETADSLDDEALPRIGREMARMSGVADETDDPVGALTALNAAHDRTHRRVDEFRAYELRDSDERAGEAVVACPSMPYPESITRGAVVGVIDPHVDRVEIDTLPPGEDQFQFRVQWE